MANGCASDMEWIHGGGRVPIHLLDFDVVCGALPSVALASRLQRSEGIGRPRFGALAFSLIGPNELRALLGSLRDYTLPPGTVSEVLARQQAIRTALKRQSVSFLELLNIGGGSRSFSTELLRVQELANLWTELQKFLVALNDHEFLGRVVSKCRPYGDILKTDISLGADTAFGDCIRRLRERRPVEDINNFNDALNVATVVQLFNQRSRRSFLPVLISQTTEVLRTRGTVQERLVADGPSPHPPSLLSNRFYLVLFRNLMECTGGRYNSARILCTQLVKRLNELEESYREIARHVQSLPDMESEGAIEHLFESHPEVADRLDTAQEDFLSESADLVTVPEHLVVPDRLQYLNQLVSSHTRALLERPEYSSQVMGVKLLQKELRGAGVLSDSIFETWYQMTSIRCHSSEDAALDSLFHLSVVECDGALLRHSKQGRSTSEITRSVLYEPHKLRLIVSLKVPSEGAILAVESLRTEGERSAQRLSFIWRHKVDIGFLLTELRDTVGADDAGQEFTIRTFTSDGSAEILCKDVADILHKTEAAASSMEHLEYAEVHVDDNIGFADGQILDGTECQAGLVFRAEALTSVLINRTADLIHRTSSVKLSKNYTAALLRRACATFGVQIPSKVAS